MGREGTSQDTAPPGVVLVTTDDSQVLILAACSAGTAWQERVPLDVWKMLHIGPDCRVKTEIISDPEARTLRLHELARAYPEAWVAW